MSKWSALGALGEAASGAGDYFGTLGETKRKAEVLAQARAMKLEDRAEGRAYDKTLLGDKRTHEGDLLKAKNELDATIRGESHDDAVELVDRKEGYRAKAASDAAKLALLNKKNQEARDLDKTKEKELRDMTYSETDEEGYAFSWGTDGKRHYSNGSVFQNGVMLKGAGGVDVEAEEPVEDSPSTLPPESLIGRDAGNDMPLEEVEPEEAVASVDPRGAPDPQWVRDRAEDNSLTPAQAAIAVRIAVVDENIDQLEAIVKYGVDGTSGNKLVTDFLGKDTVFGKLSANDETRSYNRIAFNIVEPLLRQATGAAAPDQEVRNYMSSLMPAYGDSPELVQDKIYQLRMLTYANEASLLNNVTMADIKRSIQQGRGIEYQQKLMREGKDGLKERKSDDEGYSGSMRSDIHAKYGKPKGSPK